MTPDFEALLSRICSGKTAWLGMGNSYLGDDGAGVELAKSLEAHGMAHVFHGGTFPERFIPDLRDNSFNTIVFLDAVKTGHEPGTVVLLNADTIISQHPQISTHKLSLGTLATLMQGDTGKRVWLLGIEPLTLNTSELSPVVRFTLDRISGMIAQHMSPCTSEFQEAACP